ncbi:MAG: hypothetical protein KDJ97_15220 [Anaerolineae bacterium]|nr:hypothetical protein [Anaerolineae bacterium]
MKTMIWFRIFQISVTSIFSSGLFIEGSKLVMLGIEFEGTLGTESAHLSSMIAAESAGLAMIFAGLIIFLVPFIFRANISRDRITMDYVQTSAIYHH